MDKFPEAFRRFERVVDTRDIQSFQELLVSFKYWAGWNWKGTKRQVEALKVEAWKRGIPVPPERPYKPIKPSLTWRFEWVTVNSRPQIRYRDLRTGRFIRKPER